LQPSRIRKIISDTVNINSKHDIGSYFEKYVEDILSPISVFKLRRQYEICASDIKMRVDFAILELKIIIEADGFDHHGGRSAYDKDKLRYALLQSQGWLVLNLTTNMSVQILQKLFSDMQNLRLKTVCA
jgi:very-short-patch-repair endonuclease